MLPVLLAGAGALRGSPAWAFSGGITGVSGKQGVTCAVCHRGGVAPEVRFIGPTALGLGETATYRFEVASQVPNQLRAGFNVAASDGGLDILPGSGRAPGRERRADTQWCHAERRPTRGQTTEPRSSRSNLTCAALIPIRKTGSWWSLAQDERRRIFEESSQHVKTGLKYLPAVARRLHHCRDLGENEPFDFLVAELRVTEEWAYGWEHYARGELRLWSDFRVGFVFFGGLVGALVAGALFAAIRRKSFVRGADYFAVAIPLGHAIGRIGCFSAGCCHGRPPHPVQLYEAFELVLIAWTCR